jgi:hypothetical protein
MVKYDSAQSDDVGVYDTHLVVLSPRRTAWPTQTTRSRSIEEAARAFRQKDDVDAQVLRLGRRDVRTCAVEAAE